MKTAAELRVAARAKDSAIGLPRALYPLCVAGRLVERLQLVSVEIRELQQKKAELEASARPAKDPDEPKAPSTVASRGKRTRELNQVDEQLRAKQAEHDEIATEMDDHLSPVLLTAKPGNEWLDWCAEHPPREDDLVDATARCNVDELSLDLASHVAEISDEPREKLDDSDVDFVLAQALPGDLREMALLVVRLQNGTVRVPKLLTSSSSDPSSGAS